MADIREKPAKEIIKELKEDGVDIYSYDPLLDNIEAEFVIKAFESRLLTHNSSPITALDCVILAVVHYDFKEIKLDNVKAIMNNAAILIDVRGIFDAEEAKGAIYYYETL